MRQGTGSLSFNTTLVPSARQLADAGLRVPVRITQRSSGPTRDNWRFFWLPAGGGFTVFDRRRFLGRRGFFSRRGF